MASENDSTKDDAAAPVDSRGGSFVARQAGVWLLAALLAGAAAARLAVWIEHFRAPLLIFPLLIGFGLGLLLVGLMRLTQIGHRPTILCGAAFAVFAAVVGQHYFSYRDYLNRRMAELSESSQGIKLEDVQEMTPAAAPTFAGYMEREAKWGRPLTARYTLRGGAAWASWAGDGLLMLLATLATVYIASRLPYCNGCRSWYRTIRSGRIGGEAARRLAAAAALPMREATTAARYRLSQCASGCGPCRLEIACDDARECRAWLTAAQREQVARVLDEEKPNKQNGMN